MDILLKNLSWANGSEILSGDISVQNGLISETGSGLPLRVGQVAHDFSGSFIYPGLVNAHDHLEMNLYPKLGNPPYRNYVEWARDIYHPGRSPLREIQKVDIASRLLWGGLKNLIAGATTVIHHNPWHAAFEKKGYPVHVKKISWAHSLALEKNLPANVPGDSTFVIHAAEGTDDLAHAEVSTLRDIKLLRKGTVLVHAIALTAEDIDALVEAQCAVVWCPASNFYMFDRTAPIDRLQRISCLLGTDSTLTGSPTLLHEMKVARDSQLATASQIYAMVTRLPALVFNLPEPAIRPGAAADLFIIPAASENYHDNLLQSEPADISIVMSRGSIRLLDPSIVKEVQSHKYPVYIQGKRKWCDVDVSALKKKIRNHVPEEILVQNPLWQQLEA